MNIQQLNKHFRFLTLVTSMLTSMVLSNSTFAAVIGAATDFDALPPTVQSNSVRPLVMLVMGNDHQLFYKAYNDWSDLDGDGVIESSYKHSFNYYGYFDTHKCYDYFSNRFRPRAITADKYCTGGNDGYWSGNFLNWATMTRMDIIRKVLYGGKRSTDTAAATILERAFLPTDAHSFAKYYAGSDIDDLTPFANTVTEITMCNTTYDSGAALESQDSTADPILRAVEGDFRYWDSNERWQCTWNDERRDTGNGFTTDPDETNDGLDDSPDGPDYIVRVEACTSVALTGKENCSSYPSGNLKPTGLLHSYGETDQIEFGLLTGSYSHNKSGGVVRKDISSFAGEVNVATNGTYTGTAGIVSTIDSFRISRYLYGDGDDDGIYNDTDTCPWGESEFAEGNCSNWGNPATEMYLEAVRYFAGLTRNAAFSTATNDDDGYISGLTNVGAWSSPLTAANRCAACNIIVLNASDFSYDSDSLSMAGLNGTPNRDTYTDNVGVKEGLTAAGSTWFVGENGTDNNQLCTAKTITNLSDVQGTCPNSPRLEGSYHMSGIAHYARTADINTLNDTQTVNTFAVALSPSAPQLKIPVHDASGNAIANRFVQIIPACRNDETVDLGGTTVPGNCAIVDFKVEDNHTVTNDAGTYHGRGEVTIIWEDSEQGGDYDQDMIGTLSYDITDTQITVTTDVTDDSTGFEMGFGYVIGGTTLDGFHVHSGIYDFAYTDASGVTDCSGNCNTADAATSYTYTLGTSTAKLPKDPLWYAAKWGGFTDIDGDGEPNLQQEWDSRNNDDGSLTPDGIPDNYYTGDNPGVLETQLQDVFDRVLERVSSGTAAAVIADSVAMTGAVIQALYQPLLIQNGKSVSWVGLLHSVFIDDKGNLREDTNQNGQLDDGNLNDPTDKYIKLLYADDLGRTMVHYCTSTDAGSTIGDAGSTDCPLANRAEIEVLKPIWNARDQLAIFSPTDSRLTSQRVYDTATNDASAGGRYIFSWFDDNSNRSIDTDEVVDLVTANVTSSNFGYLNAVDETEAENIVNFVRGYEDPGNTNFRSRTIDYDNDGTDEVWRLGDIIHSSPAVVSAPNAGYDTIFGDTSYTTFRSQYANRRQVVYYGGNDGMIHAINAGFFDPSQKRFCTAADCNDAATDHPLGGELWAYVPSNLLPHLRWLTEPSYPHVYYMDAKPKVYDVNIFAPSAVHPEGWGTILVIGMRLGGSDIDVDIDGDGTAETTARSAYIVLDVTNPEDPPVLLGEITDIISATGADSLLGYTLSEPNIVTRRAPSASSDWSHGSTTINDWYLTFGTGPTELASVTSDQNARLITFELELSSGVLDMDASNFHVIDTGETNSFVGSPETRDWVPDFYTDAIYFGVAGGTAAAPNGKLMRVSLTGDDPTVWIDSANWGPMLETGQPFTNQPNTIVIDNQWWVYAGTGRLYTSADNSSTAQQSFYGIKEVRKVADPTIPDPDTVFTTDQTAASYIQDVTGVVVFSDNDVDVPSGSTLDTDLGGTDTTWPLFVDEMEESQRTGWFIDFDPGERSLTWANRWNRFITFPSYTPSADLCLSEGNSTLYLIYDITGTAYPNAGLLNDTGINNGVGGFFTRPKLDIGRGIASEIFVYQHSEGARLIGQMSTGEIIDMIDLGKVGNENTGRQSWREIPIGI